MWFPQSCLWAVPAVPPPHGLVPGSDMHCQPWELKLTIVRLSKSCPINWIYRRCSGSVCFLSVVVTAEELLVLSGPASLSSEAKAASILASGQPVCAQKVLMPSDICGQCLSIFGFREIYNTCWKSFIGFHVTGCQPVSSECVCRLRHTWWNREEMGIWDLTITDRKTQ